MSYKGKIDILQAPKALAGVTFADGKITINEEQLLNDFTGTPTFTVTYEGNSVVTNFPTTDLEPRIDFIFSGIASGDYELNLSNDFGENTQTINVSTGDEAFEVVNALVSAVNGDGTLSFTASNETGNIPGADTTLRITSDTATYRFFETISLFITGFSGFADTFGTEVDDDDKDFGSSPLIAAFRTLLVDNINADGTIELSATLSGVGTHSVKFTSELSGTAGNTDVDFSSTIGTLYLSTNPLTLSGGSSGGTASNESIDISINGSVFASFTITEGDSRSDIATNIKSACDAVGSGTYTFTKVGTSVEVTTTSTFATLSLSTPSSLRLLWNSVDVNKI